VRRRLRWDLPERPLPKHPYRDSAILYGVLAGIIVAVGAATGGSVPRAIVTAAIFWVAAMGWASMRWRQRLRGKEDRR
jgi:hypothetical protein